MPSFPLRSPCFTPLNLPTIPSPTTCCRSRSLVWFWLRDLPRGTVLQTVLIPRDCSVIWASPFPSRLATTAGRIEFVILRTGRSPPVALHPTSRRRSYVRLQCSNPTLTGTSTLRIQHVCKRTSRHTPVCRNRACMKTRPAGMAAVLPERCDGTRRVGC